MDELLLAGLLIAGLVVLTPLSDRVRVPLPVALTVYGLAVAALPGVPPVRIDPDLILPLVLPPLLFAATQRSSTREFRDSARPILLLAVGLTIATTAVVAVVAHLAGLAWGPAFVLGAIVAPPDPVAATAVARRLRLPHRLVTVLEGEGMFNDATALVLYKVAVAVVVTGHLSPGGAAAELLAAVVVGVAVGGLMGALTRKALAVLHDAAAETTVTAVAPFAAYLLAERVEGSGVLAVLALGLFLRSYGHGAITAGGWLLGRAVWSYADYVITSGVFLLIGFELTDVIGSSDVGSDSLRLTVAVLVTIVVFRFLWLFPAAWLAARRSSQTPAGTPFGWRETTVAGWAGMRGVVTVATALALPLTTDDGAAFPDREVVVLVALVAVLVTLVAQGLTLAPLVRRLQVGEEGPHAEEVTLLRREAAEAALATVRDEREALPHPVRAAAVAQYEGYLAAQAALDSARVGGADEAGYPDALERLLRKASEAERNVALDARRDGRVSAAAVDDVLQDIESRAVRDYD